MVCDAHPSTIMLPPKLAVVAITLAAEGEVTVGATEAAPVPDAATLILAAPPPPIIILPL